MKKKKNSRILECRAPIGHRWWAACPRIGPRRVSPPWWKFTFYRRHYKTDWHLLDHVITVQCSIQRASSHEAISTTTSTTAAAAAAAATAATATTATTISPSPPSLTSPLPRVHHRHLHRSHHRHRGHLLLYVSTRSTVLLLLIFPPSATVEEERTAAHRRGGYLSRVLRPENSAQTLLYFGSRCTLFSRQRREIHSRESLRPFVRSIGGEKRERERKHS